MLLTEQQVADRIGVSRHGVRKWRKEGKIGFVRINHTVRFEEAEVIAFIERSRQRPLCRVCNTQTAPEVEQDDMVGAVAQLAQAPAASPVGNPV